MDGRQREGPNLVEEISSGRLGERVRELRRKRGLTLDALASRSGVSRAMISKLERGEKNSTLVVAARVAEGLGISLMQLVGVEQRRRVVAVPRQARMVVRDPQTGIERQTAGGCPVVGKERALRGLREPLALRPRAAAFAVAPVVVEPVRGFL